MKQQQVRQGDVLLVPVRKKAPATVESIDRVILAYGEVTGHAHEVVADALSEAERAAAVPAMLVEDNGETALYVAAPCALVHQEHGRIALAPGAYRVVRQREYTPEAIRNVAD